ncbi:NADH-quinone oxidoreductase subunit C [Epidermidibacterium keratini]|uniref:NADH-quinone oxidoreductase subunit C n=1 Tax=Epidermidibacterium keratini TaxID=1891644 RepID=A0A7L4YT67_9ACTN|nr:NADH-quinone oxidoreductase subunit C [Epidermidibacterium keratini]
MPHKAPKPERFDDTPIAQQAGRAGSFGVTGTGDTSGFGGLRIHAGSGIPSRSTDRPYGGYFDEVADRFAKAYSQWRQAHIATIVDRGEITFYVEKSHIARILKVARDDAELRFELLSSLSGVDYYRGDAGIAASGDPKQDEYAAQRLHVVYHLLSMTFRRRVRFEVATTVENPHVPTATEVYPTADWQERETYDMFGVIFDGHHALTRILMPDDWDGFPQRKDYPLGGIPVEYHDATIPPPDERRAYK